MASQDIVGRRAKGTRCLGTFKVSGIHLVERMDWPPFWDGELRAEAEACPSSAFGQEASAEWGRRAGKARAEEPAGSGWEAEVSGLSFRMMQPGGALQRWAGGLLPH